MRARVTNDVPSCPRCGYTGQGVPYFRRPGHMGLLVGAGLISYGIGSLVYWMMRKNSVVCPNCGLRWDWSGTARQIAPPRGSSSDRKAMQAFQQEQPLPKSGIGRRVAGVLIALFGVMLITVGIAEIELAAVAVGAVFGLTGSASFWWGYSALQERRKAVITGLQRKVLRLATQSSGVLTVTEVAAELNLSLPAAENVLNDLDDGFRVRSDVTADGVIVYEFPEVMHRPRLESGPELS